MGVHEYYANMAANCRRGHWYCANLTTVKKAMTKERLINGGFYDLATAYQSVHVNYWNRRVPNGTHGGVRGRRLVTASYSIFDKSDHFLPKQKRYWSFELRFFAHATLGQLLLESSSFFLIVPDALWNTYGHFGSRLFEKGKFVSDVQTCVTILTLTGKNDHT